jgi:hypothetical protein
MFGPPGRAYVYLCYGLHTMLNVVCEGEGTAAAVLIRGAVAIAGADVVTERRGGRLDLSGPGKVGQALGLDPSWSGAPLDEALRLCAGAAPAGATRRSGPRVGIDYAAPADRALPWRRWLEGRAQRRPPRTCAGASCAAREGGAICDSEKDDDGSARGVTEVLKDLAKRGALSVLIEGGGTVLGQAFREHLVDEVYWYIAPRICGGGTPSLAGPSLPQSIELENVTLHPMGDNVLVHGFPASQRQQD